jgi:hypothetical protein
MIRTFCDCCSKEIDSSKATTENMFVTPFKRVNIGRYSTGNKCRNDYTTAYLIRLKITAEIYRPDNLLNVINPEMFVGNNLCDDCIIDTLRSSGV